MTLLLLTLGSSHLKWWWGSFVRFFGLGDKGVVLSGDLASRPIQWLQGGVRKGVHPTGPERRLAVTSMLLGMVLMCGAVMKDPEPCEL
jgi:hypothetical protein